MEILCFEQALKLARGRIARQNSTIIGVGDGLY